VWPRGSETKNSWQQQCEREMSRAVDRLRPTAREPPSTAAVVMFAFSFFLSLVTRYCCSGHVCFFFFFSFFFLSLVSCYCCSGHVTHVSFFFFLFFFFGLALPLQWSCLLFFFFFFLLSEGIGCFYYPKSLGGYHHFNCHSLHTGQSSFTALRLIPMHSSSSLLYFLLQKPIKSQTMALYVKPISIPTHSISNLF
jgi:hypothetical protein